MKVPHPDRVSIWCCFSGAGIGEIDIFSENLDANKMKNILKDHLLSSAKTLFKEGAWWFQQDNDPKHTSKLVKKCFFYNGIQQIEFPPYSPDLNPMENMWNDIKTSC